MRIWLRRFGKRGTGRAVVWRKGKPFVRLENKLEPIVLESGWTPASSLIATLEKDQAKWKAEPWGV